MGRNAIRIFFLILTLISSYFAFVYKISEELKGHLIVITILLGLLFLGSLFTPKALDSAFGV